MTSILSNSHAIQKHRISKAHMFLLTTWYGKVHILSEGNNVQEQHYQTTDVHNTNTFTIMVMGHEFFINIQ